MRFLLPAKTHETPLQVGFEAKIALFNTSLLPARRKMEDLVTLARQVAPPVPN